MTPIVIGIDPSLSETGLATTTDLLIVGGDAHLGDDRLTRIYNAVICYAEDADLAVLEDLPTGAHGAGKTGMAQGVIRLALNQLCVPYVTLVPSTVKKFATGSGTASKPDMRMALYQRAGLDVKNDNKVDAWWLRAIGMDALGHPIVSIPKAHRGPGLAKVQWPQVTRG